MLLLDARLFDGRDRCSFVANVFNDEEPEIEDLDAETEPTLTLAERLWVSVGQLPGG